MPKISDLSKEKRAQIQVLYEQGKSQAEMSKTVKCSRRALQYGITRFKEIRSQKNRPKSGSEYVTTKREDRQLLRASLKIRKKISFNLAAELSIEFKMRNSLRTIRRRLSEAGLRAYKARKKPWLSERIKKARYEWALKHQSYTDTDWSTIVWSDESSFEIQYASALIAMAKVREIKWSRCGGKGNLGKYYEREPRICPAGKPNKGFGDAVSGSMAYYPLQDHADAILRDAVIPPAESPIKLPPRQYPVVDVRFLGFNTEAKKVVNPKPLSKAETLVNDLKETIYNSYWMKPLGERADQIPGLPPGMDLYQTTFGKKTPVDRLYDVIMPPVPLPDKTPASSEPAYQQDRKYIAPFNRNYIYGRNDKVDPSGKRVPCCLIDERVVGGKEQAQIISKIQADLLKQTEPMIGEVLRPNQVLDVVPEGQVFGKLSTSKTGVAHDLVGCALNPDAIYFYQCVEHLNTLRKILRNVKEPTFFRELYMELRYMDADLSGWLPIQKVYSECGKRMLRFDYKKMTTLMAQLGGIAENRIDYKLLLKTLNYKEPLPMLPKICLLPRDCLEYETTYREMIRPKCVEERPIAGVRSFRWDMGHPHVPPSMCRASMVNLPNESDVRSCMAPSIMTMHTLTHRDMYAVRSPQAIRNVFEQAKNKKYTDDEFQRLWSAAQKQSREGNVCFQTFREVDEMID